MNLYILAAVGLLFAALSAATMVEHSSAAAARAQRDSAQTEVKRLKGVEAQLATEHDENEASKAANGKCQASVQELGAQARLSKQWAEQRVAAAEADARKKIAAASQLTPVADAKPEDACKNASIYWKQFKGQP
jgi:uncharacterized protein YqfA (UPF0365 family)